MQAFAFNIRRAKFQDPRVRLAFNYAFDFEEMNKQIFFGQYTRISSYFQGTELASSGLPEGRELEILESVYATRSPPELFTTAYSNPVGGDPQAVRNNLREALRLFKEAGYEVRNGKLVDSKTGEPYSVEFLADDPSFERVFLFYKPSLDRLGITVWCAPSMTRNTSNRLRAWDFDMITNSWGELLSPGNEQRGYWGSQAADQPGSRNLIGIKNPGRRRHDRSGHLRQEPGRSRRRHARARPRACFGTTTSCRNGAYGKERTARWNRFGRPEVLPKYGYRPLPDRVVVGCRQSGEGRKPAVNKGARSSLSRRHFVVGTAAVIGASAFAAARAEDEIESHGISAFGDLAYPPDFHHFRYVDPNAPKGGTFSQIGPNRQFNQNFLTFNSLNGYILRGDAAQGMELTFATLMARSGDEPDAMYGLAAAKVRRSADGLTYRFFIRPEAKFHDGTRLTAADAAFSLNILKEKGHPIITQLLRDFTGAKADDYSVVVTFAPNRARDVPLFVAGLPIFSRAYYATKPFDESTLDVPLGSGAYRVGRFEAGRFIEYERVKDWWGADLPVARGQNNFDIVRFEYYRDREVGFEGFTAGSYLFREEFTSRTWATRYDFPCLQGRPCQTRHAARRYPVRRPRLVHQHAARKVCRSAAARSAL